MKFISLMLITSILYSQICLASNSDKAALIVTKLISQNNKTYVVESSDADEWPMTRLNSSQGSGEDEEKKYDVCFRGNPNKVMNILEEIIKEENKSVNKDRRTKIIFNLQIAANRYRGYPADYIIIETGWKGDKRPYFLDAFKPCRN